MPVSNFSSVLVMRKTTRFLPCLRWAVFSSPAIGCPGTHAQRLAVDCYFDDVFEVFHGAFEVNFEMRGFGQGFEIDVPGV